MVRADVNRSTLHPSIHLLALMSAVLVPVARSCPQPVDGPAGAGTTIPFATTGLPDANRAPPRFITLPEGERGGFAALAGALTRASEGRVELDFEAVTRPEPQGRPDYGDTGPSPYLTVVPTKPEPGGWNPPPVVLGNGETLWPLAVFRLATTARVLSQEAVGQRLAHFLRPDVYLLAVRPESLGSGFELLHARPQEGEGGDREAELQAAVGGIWIRAQPALSPGKLIGPNRAFVMADPSPESPPLRAFIWSGPIHAEQLHRVCLQLDLLPPMDR
jgi:hypothetical protein